MMVDGSVGSGATSGTRAGLAAWHEVVAARDPAKLAELLTEDVIFWSPIVHSAQRGKDLVMLYLSGAVAVLGNESFTYVRELADGPAVVLEFTSTVDGITVNGVTICDCAEISSALTHTILRTVRHPTRPVPPNHARNHHRRHATGSCPVRAIRSERPRGPGYERRVSAASPAAKNRAADLASINRQRSCEHQQTASIKEPVPPDRSP